MPYQAGSTWTVLRSFADYLDIVSAFDPKFVGLAIDLFHVGHLAEAYDRIPEYANRLALVQIADRNINKPHIGLSKGRNVEYRMVPGEGGLQIDRWIDKLNRHGYRGAFELEVHGKGFSRGNYRSTIDDSLHYLCSPRRSFNMNRKISEEEKKRRERRREKAQKQPELNLQSRW